MLSPVYKKSRKKDRKLPQKSFFFDSRGSTKLDNEKHFHHSAHPYDSPLTGQGSRQIHKFTFIGVCPPGGTKGDTTRPT